jgi:hypothetical protein
MSVYSSFSGRTTWAQALFWLLVFGRSSSSSSPPLGGALRIASRIIGLACWSFGNPASLLRYLHCLLSRKTIIGVILALVNNGVIGFVFIQLIIALGCRLNITWICSDLFFWPHHHISAPNTADALITVVVTFLTFPGVIPYWPWSLWILFSILCAFAILLV